MHNYNIYKDCKAWNNISHLDFVYIKEEKTDIWE